MIRLAAQYAVHHFGAGSSDPAMQAWAVFWFVKHQVKFVVDEAPMFRLGEPNQQDLLISPAVLIRMNRPQEDCDGFTMLSCALLKALGIPFVIVTIAAAADDPQRWSHVFCMAMLPSGPLPIDASHGSGPGWMVPAAHTYRWQCWSCDGQPVNVQRPRRHSLNGWVPTGLGQDPSAVDPTTEEFYDPTVGLPTDLTLPPLAATSGFTPPPQTVTVGSSPSSSSSGFNWQSFLTNLTNVAGQTTTAVVKAQTAEQLAASGAYATSNLLGSLLPILLIVGGVMLISSVMEKH